MVEVKERRHLKESTYLNLWLWENHRTDLQWRRVRLGLMATKGMARMYNVTLRWADAVFIHNGEVYIVEAKLKPVIGAIGQLEYYKKQFKVTPEFKHFHENKINLIFLCPVLDLGLVEHCSDKGIQYEHWIPKGFEPVDGQLLEIEK